MFSRRLGIELAPSLEIFRFVTLRDALPDRRMYRLSRIAKMAATFRLAATNSRMDE